MVSSFQASLAKLLGSLRAAINYRLSAPDSQNAYQGEEPHPQWLFNSYRQD